MGSRDSSIKVLPRRMNARQRKQVLAGTLGSGIEYIDWAIYGSLSPLFASSFFPAAVPAAALLGTLAIFATGFIMRPVGAIVLGVFADHHGRKKGLLLSILIMTLGGYLVAFSPTYNQIGILAPMFLLIARLAQGFATGGEYGTAITYIVESAPPGRRNFAGSFQQVTTAAGVLLAGIIVFILTTTMPDNALTEWGWRIGFGVAATLSLLTLWFRSTVGETDAFETMKQESQGYALHFFKFLRTHWRTILWVMVYSIPLVILYYIWIIYMPAFAHTSYGIPLSLTVLSANISLVFLLIVLPFIGRLADKYGRKTMLIVSYAGMMLLAFPAFEFMGASFWSLLIFQLTALLLYSPNLATFAAMLGDRFPADVRTTGTGVPYAIVVAAFGGTAPYIITAIQGAGLGSLVWLYPAAAAALGVVIFATMRDKTELDDESVSVAS